MDEFLKWLADNPIATYSIIAALGFLVLVIIILYLTAFIQGRDISFWPPKISVKPNQENKLNKSAAKKILVRETKTGITYLKDHRGFWRPINDVDTANYLKRVFGYQEDESIETESTPLQPLGDEVIPLRDWKRPRTKAENLSLDAQFSTQVLKKYIRTKSASKILSFMIRNNSEHDLQINLAELVFDTDAPLVARDISPKNNPKIVGLLTCKLLFNDGSESQKIPSQGEAQLDLFLQRQFTTSETSAIASVRLGYIRVKGIFCETEIMFHLYV